MSRIATESRRWLSRANWQARDSSWSQVRRFAAPVRASVRASAASCTAWVCATENRSTKRSRTSTDITAAPAAITGQATVPAVEALEEQHGRRQQQADG